MADDIKDQSGLTKKSPKSLEAVEGFKGFFTNDHQAYVARKSERLSTAVHLVTQVVPQDEPIRNSLRTRALEIGAVTMDQQKLGALGPDGFGSRCAEMGSMLDTAQATGLISTMNARLIVDEYSKLAQFVKDRYSFIRAHTSDLKDIEQRASHKGHEKDTTSIRHDSIKTVKDINQSSSRRKDILALFNSKDRISVKDAVDAIDGVSEKTLQRDLLAMVADNILIKEGERRWSTYIRSVHGAQDPI